MPLLFKLEESVPKPDTSFNLSTLNLNSCSETESEYFASKLKHDDIHPLLKFVEKCDEKICFVNTKEEETSLSIAIYRNSVALCRALIEKGCDVHKQAKVPPFYIRLSPLSHAVAQGNIELVKLLLQNGCSSTVSDEFGKCAVQCAICGGHVDILKLFLEKGCDPNTRILDTMFTLLHEATYRGSVDAVKALLEAGADPNNYEFNDRTIPAFHTNKVSIHKLLLKYGSDINWRGRSGETILHSAVYMGHSELVEVLLANGALMNYSQTVITFSRNNIARNIQEKDVFQLAFSEEHFNICLILVQHGYQMDRLSQKYVTIWSDIASSVMFELAKIVYLDNKGACSNQIQSSANVYDSCTDNLKCWIDDNLFTVQSLSSISRSALRQSLISSHPKMSIQCKLNQLQCVPPKLFSYIMYK